MERLVVGGNIERRNWELWKASLFDFSFVRKMFGVLVRALREGFIYIQ